VVRAGPQGWRSLRMPIWAGTQRAALAAMFCDAPTHVVCAKAEGRQVSERVLAACLEFFSRHRASDRGGVLFFAVGRRSHR